MIICSVRPWSIIALLKALVADVTCRGCFRIPFYGISLQVDVPYGILCILELFHTCDHVVCLFECRRHGMENESRVDEMYFRFSAESVVIRRPHTQYMTPGLQ